MVRRVLLFVGAVLLALVGTGLVFAYASSADRRALEGQQPVPVLVAVETIPAETPVSAAEEQGLFELTELPRAAVPPGALSDTAQIDTKVTGAAISPGEVLLAAKFVDPAVAGVLNIPESKLAVSVELTDPGRVAGFVVPGSEVAIFATYAAETEGEAASAVESETTQLLLPRVKVLAAGPTSLRGSATDEGEGSATAEEPIKTSVLTVAVTQEEAERLIHGAQTGRVYFALLTTDSQTGPSAGVSNRTLSVMGN